LNQPPESVKVTYPTGELVKDRVIGNYRIYKGKVTIKLVVQRARGDGRPFVAAIYLQAFCERWTVLPATIKLPIP
jgi:hypothetical protein